MEPVSVRGNIMTKNFTIKRCQFRLDGVGQKCGKTFRVAQHELAVRKFCDDHIGSGKKSVFPRTTNAYGKVKNAEMMHDWVRKQMEKEDEDNKTIKDLVAKVERLENIIDRISSNQRVVASVVRKEMKTEMFKTTVDSIVVKRLRKSLYGDEEE